MSSSNQLHISSLAFNVSSSDLLAWARTIAPAVHAEVAVDPVTNRSLGTATITFESVTDAAQAQRELSRIPIGGKNVVLTIAA